MTHICVNKLTIIGSDNGLSPDRRQAIIWTNAGILLIVPLGTNFSEILIDVLTFSLKKMRLKVSSANRWPFCHGLNVLVICFLMLYFPKYYQYNIWHNPKQLTFFYKYWRFYSCKRYINYINLTYIHKIHGRWYVTFTDFPVTNEVHKLSSLLWESFKPQVPP